MSLEYRIVPVMSAEQLTLMKKITIEILEIYDNRTNKSQSFEDFIKNYKNKESNVIN